MLEATLVMCRWGLAARLYAGTFISAFKKKPVDLSDVIELTDSEPDVEIVAASNVSTNAKRRRKDPGETKEEVVVKSENLVFSETSRRKQRKLNHACKFLRPHIVWVIVI